MKKAVLMLIALALIAALAAPALAEGAGKHFIFSDTTFNPENEEPDVNPHNAYSGWAALRYGIGETLFRYDEKMAVQPWLAESYKNIDPTTWEITLRDGVKFHSGRAMDAEAVKENFEHLTAVHKRAALQLSIESMEADGRKLTFKTSKPVPAFINFLSDPYGCVIDAAAGIKDGVASGTGPFIPTYCKSGERLELKANDGYWGGRPKLGTVTVRTISDGDTATMALQTGEADAAYGLPYASYPLFRNDDFDFTSAATSRAFFAWMNMEQGPTTDPAVRKAIAKGIDKQGFVDVLLQGNGVVGHGCYPDGPAYGGQHVKAEGYDPEGAKRLLDEAGWKPGPDGIRVKDGRRLVIRWLTYPSRQELPLLAESAQATLKEIGIEVDVNVTPSHNDIKTDRSKWDVYASALVTAPTGDPEFFFVSNCLDSSPVNVSKYHSDKLEELAKKMAAEFDPAKRAELAIEMQQTILDDDAYVFCSFLKMSMVMKRGVTGLKAYPCDFYELNAELDKNY